MALQNNSATEVERQIRVLLQAWLVGWGGGMGNAGEIKINLKGKDAFTSCRHFFEKRTGSFSSAILAS